MEIYMSIKIFTEKEIEILAQNQYVKSVSKKGITYTEEFKREYISESEKGKSSTEIFEEHGFDMTILGKDRAKSAGKRWRTAYNENGLTGLEDTRKISSGRPRTKDLSLEEKFARLEAQNLLLKAEIELLKKIDMAERRLRRKK